MAIPPEKSANLGLQQVTPVMWPPDLKAALTFFVEVLGFQLHWLGGGYAYVAREGVAFRLMDRTIYPNVAPGDRRFAYYIDVADVDALYAALKDRLDSLPAGDVHGPMDKPYNQRELCVLAPDGDLIVFGQEIERAPGEAQGTAPA